jgi:hypothetical protein
VSSWALFGVRLSHSRKQAMSQEPKQMGDVEFQGKDISTPGVKFDKLAISGRGELLLVSLVADTQQVKQIRAILCGGAKAVIMAGGINVNQPGKADWYAKQPCKLYPSEEGYQCYTHKIGYGMAHALFLTRTPGFMKVVTPESLWQELNNVRFTTPILKEWVPYIEEQLRNMSRLEDAECFNCKCGILSATTTSLDEVISQGLAQDNILIPRPARAG